MDEAILSILDEVKDPEIPTISIVEMGLIDSIEVEGKSVRVGMIPTFSGCPALDVMKRDVHDSLVQRGYQPEVSILRKPWSTDRMSDSAREKMKSIGLAPPHVHHGNVEWEMFAPVACPYCKSTDTTVENGFGPTLCRAIYYCNSCQQPFEKFKPL